VFWRLPHPLLGLVGGLVAFLVLSVIVVAIAGFGAGLPERLVVVAGPVGAFFKVATWSRVR
jgi:hypothetical protein